MYTKAITNDSNIPFQKTTQNNTLGMDFFFLSAEVLAVVVSFKSRGCYKFRAVTVM